MTDTIDRLGVTAAALAIFSDVPVREIDEDELIYLAEEAGELVVWVPAAGRYYVHVAGRTLRFEKRDEVVEVTVYVDGQLVEFFNDDPHKEERPWPLWMN